MMLDYEALECGISTPADRYYRIVEKMNEIIDTLKYQEEKIISLQNMISKGDKASLEEQS